MSIDLRAGFLFRTTDHHGNLTVPPFVGSAVANGLKIFALTMVKLFISSGADAQLPCLCLASPMNR